MQYVYLGRTGLKVSRLALGTMNFGELTDEAESFSIMNEALDAGINLFDTADVYGGPQTPGMERGFGTFEEIIGWLAFAGRSARSICFSRRSRTSQWRLDRAIAGQIISIRAGPSGRRG